MFSSEFCKIYKSTFSYSTPHVAASEFWRFSFNLEELRNSVSGNVGSPNFVFRFLEQKFLEFFEATESYISALSLSDKIFSTVVKCLCGWNCLTLHIFFPSLPSSKWWTICLKSYGKLWFIFYPSRLFMSAFQQY